MKCKCHVFTRTSRRKEMMQACPTSVSGVPNATASLSEAARDKLAHESPGY
jgi:hypothetical protein